MKFRVTIHVPAGMNGFLRDAYFPCIPRVGDIVETDDDGTGHMGERYVKYVVITEGADTPYVILRPTEEDLRPRSR